MILDQHFAKQAVSERLWPGIDGKKGEGQPSSEESRYLMVDLAQRQIGGEQEQLNLVKPVPTRAERPSPQGDPQKVKGRREQPHSKQVEIERKAEIALPFDEERPAIGPGPEIESQLEEDAADPAEQGEPPCDVEMVAAAPGCQAASQVSLVLDCLRQKPPLPGDFEPPDSMDREAGTIRAVD
jgi:hypothetical protein